MVPTAEIVSKMALVAVILAMLDILYSQISPAKRVAWTIVSCVAADIAPLASLASATTVPHRPVKLAVEVVHSAVLILENVILDVVKTTALPITQKQDSVNFQQLLWMTVPVLQWAKEWIMDS